MASAAYHLRQALGCLRQSPYAAFVAAATVAVALAVSGASLLAVRALEAGLRAYGADARLTIFLDPSAVNDGEALAKKAAESAGGGASAEFVSPDVAMARLRADLGEAGAALAGLAANPLPPSIEVRLATAQLARGDLSEVGAVAARLRALPFAVEVDYGRSFIDRLETLLLAVRAVGFALFAFVLAIALFLVGNVVRLTVYARRDEVDILRLVGATDGFIAAPFVLEGGLQGLAGGVAATILAVLGERLALPGLVAGLGFGSEFLPEPLGPGALALFVLAGAGIGLGASLVAVLRFLRSAA